VKSGDEQPQTAIGDTAFYEAVETLVRLRLTTLVTPLSSS
jgi:hypothetical protein